MKALLAALALLAPLAASAANPPSLVCDPDASVHFQTSWLGVNSVVLSAGSEWKLPWTGHEPLTSGAELGALARATDAPEELRSLPVATPFLTFTPRDQGAPTLYVSGDLLRGTEDDGLVVTELGSKLSAYHCRSR